MNENQKFSVIHVAGALLCFVKKNHEINFDFNIYKSIKSYI